MSRLRRVWEMWKIHGAPRCWAYNFDTGEMCRRVIWPWQDVSGDGEHATHASCQAASDASFDRLGLAEDVAA